MLLSLVIAAHLLPGQVSLLVGNTSEADRKGFASGVIMSVSLVNRTSQPVKAWTPMLHMSLEVVDLSGKLKRSNVVPYMVVSERHQVALEPYGFHRTLVNFGSYYRLRDAAPGTYPMKAVYYEEAADGDASRQKMAWRGEVGRIESEPFDLIIDPDRSVWIKLKLGRAN